MSAQPPKAAVRAGEQSALPIAPEEPSAIDAAVQQIVQMVPPEKREQALTILATVEEFSGQLPHPKHAAEYEELCPGAFNRLLVMRERELDYSIERDRESQSHARHWELSDQRNASRHTTLGMSLGFLLGLSLIGGAVACAFIGQPILGGGLIAASAVSMVPAFLNGRRERGDRRDTKPVDASSDIPAQTRKSLKPPQRQNKKR